MGWLTQQMTVRRWVAVVASLCMLGAGVAWGHALGPDGSAPTRQPLSGVVESIDEGGALCIGRRSGEVECYQAPGIGLKVGDPVKFRVRKEPIDPNDPELGRQLVIVWIGRN